MVLGVDTAYDSAGGWGVMGGEKVWEPKLLFEEAEFRPTDGKSDNQR